MSAAHSQTDEPRTLSSLLDVLAELANSRKEKVHLSTILEVFHERGFGVLLFLLALPAALPVPALGINMIIALPILLLTIQQAMGRHTVWMPEKIQKRSLKPKQITGFIKKAEPIINFLEIFFKPRLGFITRGIFSLFIGVFGTIFALSITLPIPLTNTVPAMAIALMSVGVIMRDGLAVIGGIILGCIWIGLLSYFALFFGTEGLIYFKDMIKGFIGVS